MEHATQINGCAHFRLVFGEWCESMHYETMRSLLRANGKQRQSPERDPKRATFSVQASLSNAIAGARMLSALFRCHDRPKTSPFQPHKQKIRM